VRRGFTIIELSFVLAVMAILVGLTVPTYQFLVHRARADEARTTVHAIAHAELQYHRDHRRYLPCEDGAAIPRGPARFPNDKACWEQLGIRLDGPVRYRYQVKQDGDSFTVLAEGDLDGDGRSSLFSLAGRDLQLTVKDELE
jgi:prepilin-type N-terminal cleavage/methylation domain-containing protein